MLARRLLLLAAVLLLIAVVAAGLAPQDPAQDTALQGSQLPPGREIARQISADDSDRRVRIRRGDVLSLDVSGEVPDSVLIERLDRIDSIDPSTPAHFEILADAPAGVYPIRLIDADRQIGTIEISD